MAKPSKSMALPRRLHTDIAKAIKPYNTKAGRLIWSWNRVHGVFAEAFCALVSPDNGRLGQAIWHSIASDAGQRQMLLAALENNHSCGPESSDALRWIILVMESLSEHRNDIAHTPMSHSIDFLIREICIVADPTRSKPGSAQRLSKPELAKFHGLLIGDLTQVFHYGEFALQALFDKGRKGWPQTPRLKSVPHAKVPLTRSQSNRQTKRRLARQQQNKLLGTPAARKKAERERRAGLLAAAKARASVAP